MRFGTHTNKMALVLPTDGFTSIGIATGDQNVSQSRSSRPYAICSAFVLGMMVAVIGLLTVQHVGLGESSFTHLFSLPAVPKVQPVSGAILRSGQSHRLAADIPNGKRAASRALVLMNKAPFPRLPDESGPNGNRNQSHSESQASSLLDELVSGSISKFIDELEAPGPNLKLPVPSVAKCLDIVCADIGERIEDSGSNDESIKLQVDLQRTYAALQQRGLLRGFSSRVDTLLPLPRQIQPDDLERLTGLTMSAFEPPIDSQSPNMFLTPAAFLAVKSSLVDFSLDPRVVIGGLLAAVLAEKMSSASEAGTRILKHEAGHMLIAYLLGIPVQACLVNDFALREDGRFDNAGRKGGKAAVVFYTPEFGRELDTSAGPAIKYIDRYSIVLMAGIAAEAMAYGDAKGGSADEITLIRLLSSLKTGPWSIPQIMDQARWAVAQAFLLLLEHQSVYKALCGALARGASIGEAIMVIEGALPNEMILAQTREKMLAGIEARLTDKDEKDAGAAKNTGGTPVRIFKS